MTDIKDIVYCDDAINIKKKKIKAMVQAKQARADEKKQKAMAEMQDILKKHDMKLSVGACNCCDSPWVGFEYKGKMVLNATYAGFDMFEDEDDS